MAAYISKVEIKNFRNFKNLNVSLASKAVIVGENKVGKSNFIYALRLILDPDLPDSSRMLTQEDFWDGYQNPLKSGKAIDISVYISGFEKNSKLLAILADAIVSVENNKPVAKITYRFYKREVEDSAENPLDDYTYIVFAGNNESSTFGYYERKWMPLQILPALRDGERDLQSWRNSPLRPLIENLNVNQKDLSSAAKLIDKATSKMLKIPQINALETNIKKRIEGMIGEIHSVSPSLGFLETDSSRLLQSLKLYVDGAHQRNISNTSLGLCNVIYLSLLLLELERKERSGERATTFLAIEEPEAHLHPHLQRLVYSDFFSKKENCVLMTTHSPHIASVSPLKSIVAMRSNGSPLMSKAYSATNAIFTDHEIQDLQRYLDATRAEILFSKKVILVEGDSELYLIPHYARLKGIPLDQAGISVCSVHGTDFLPYIKLLSKKSLNIEFIMLTDADPIYNADKSFKAYSGYTRIRKILKFLSKDIIDQYDHLIDEYDYEKVDKLISTKNIYVNVHTLEIDLAKKNPEAFKKAFQDLRNSKLANERFSKLVGDLSTLQSQKKFLRYIESVGKGRFAQRLSNLITLKGIPSYIDEALDSLNEKYDY